MSDLMRLSQIPTFGRQAADPRKALIRPRIGLGKISTTCQGCTRKSELRRHKLRSKGFNRKDNQIILCSDCSYIITRIKRIVNPTRDLEYQIVIELLKMEVARRNSIVEKLGTEIRLIPFDEALIKKLYSYANNGQMGNQKI